MITINVNTSSNSPKLKKKLEKALNDILEAELKKSIEPGTKGVRFGYSVNTEFTSSAMGPHYGGRRYIQPDN